MTSTMFKHTFLLFFPVLLLWTACETPVFEAPAPRERTYLHFLNANDAYPSIDVEVNSYEQDQLWARDLAFLESWPKGGYASLLTVPDEDTLNNIQGGIEVEIREAGTSNVLVPSTMLKLNADIQATLCLVDSFGKPILVKTIDIMPEKTGELAHIRFMNVNSYHLSVSLVVQGEDVQIQNLNFLNYSSFRTLEEGRYTFQFVDDFSGKVLVSLEDMEVKRHQVYNFLLTHQGGQAVGDVERLERKSCCTN